MSSVLSRARPIGLLLLVCTAFGLGLTEYYSRPTPADWQCGAPVDAASLVIGWAYFGAWSLSFYPQVVLNWERRSVVGFAFDFAGLNLVGFGCYAAFNCALFYSPSIRAAYERSHGGEAPAVRLNDIVFALHAVALSAVLLVQIAILPRGAQRFSRLCKAAIVVFLIALPIAMVLAARRACERCTWLNVLYALSYVKLAITLTK